MALDRRDSVAVTLSLPRVGRATPPGSPIDASANPSQPMFITAFEDGSIEIEIAGVSWSAV